MDSSDRSRTLSLSEVVWLTPWGALALGVPLIWVLSSPDAAMVGFGLVWLLIFALTPFMLLGAAFGGPTAGYVLGGLVAATAVLGPAIMALRAVIGSRDRVTRVISVNAGAFWLLIWIGVGASISSFDRAWPY